MQKKSSRIPGLLAFVISWTANNGAADELVISGTVIDAQGRPIPSASISIAGTSHGVEASGDYSIVVSSADTYRLSISAQGHFPFIQTLSRADFSDSNRRTAAIGVPPITLVRRKADRHLYVFAGDTMMGRRFVEPLGGEPALIRPATVAEDARSILQHAKPYLELADFASVNLETQLSDSLPPSALQKSVTFYTTTTIAAALKSAGVDYTALGNNHTFDYLDVGLSRTIHALDDARLAYSGAGRTAGEARKPHTMNVGQQRVDLLSYVGWPGNFLPNQVAETDKGGAAYGTAASIAEDLGEIPDESMAVLQYHSGLEYASNPPVAEETQLKLSIDRGADLALGHHSHVLQGFEVYKGKLIAYSLGNFVFDQYLYSTHSTMLLFAWYDGDNFYRAEIVPIHVNGYVPTPATGHIRYDILQRLMRLADPASVCWSRSGMHGAFQECSPEARPLEAQRLILSDVDERAPGSVVRLDALAADPLRPIQSINTTRPFRLGLDILRRGDFEYSGLFGTHDRTWIDDERVSVVQRESVQMQIDVPAGETATTGMKAFTRVFTRSNPATVSGRVRTNGCVRLNFTLQRRPDGMSFGDALENGPISSIGEFMATSPDWAEFTMSFSLPRTFTRSIRLMIDVENCSLSKAVARVEVDDLALIEWRTPWIASGELPAGSDRVQATHVQTLPGVGEAP